MARRADRRALSRRAAIGAILGASLLAGCGSLSPSLAPIEADVCIYGATSAGVVAAVEAVRSGRTVALLDCDLWIGGLTTSGLGATDVGSASAIGGIAREFYQALRRHYDDDANWTVEPRSAFQGRGQEPARDCAFSFEPHVASAQFERMLADVGVAPIRDRLDRSGRGVDMRDGRIAEIRTVGGLRVRARVYLDCTYEGDLMAAAGCSYVVGRESNEHYGETLNGVAVQHATKHQFAMRVDPYVRPGDPMSGLLPGIEPAGEEPDGAQDHRVQAYCYRICATDAPANRVPWPKPEGYDEGEFELLLRWYDAGAKMAPWHPVWMPNRKTDSNNNGAVSTDAIGLNYSYPEADYEERERIVAAHKRYQQGLLWTLANHPRVPLAVRQQFQRFGLAKDEFQQHGHWPPLLYVREARRLVGEEVVTEAHCTGTVVTDQPVGLGAYAMDSHNVRRHVQDGAVRNEGDVQVRVPKPYGIPFGALLPRRHECANLLVPVCVSASHIAYGSVRMEPVFMILAQSAAVAASIAMERDLAVQDVGYEELASRLIARGQQGPVRATDPKSGH
jgi:hypothetical protein